MNLGKEGKNLLLAAIFAWGVFVLFTTYPGLLLAIIAIQAGSGAVHKLAQKVPGLQPIVDFIWDKAELNKD